jgi:GGDEF domain-containing protein
MDFIVTQDGRYLGIGKPKTLLRNITEQQIRFAQYANPLTQLPGNVPIYETIDALLMSGTAFVMAYFDLNAFKPYNDFYGYSKGDDVIKCVAEIIQDHVDPIDDFVGHIGGDDFVVVFRSIDWRMRCERILQWFSQQVAAFYDRNDWQKGGIWSEDRRGDKRFFEPLSLSVGVVCPDPLLCKSHHAIAALAADAKHQAKRLGGNQIFISRRKAATRLQPEQGSSRQCC